MLKKLWGYQINEETAKSVKVRAFKLLCWFLAAMLCFTIVSRVANSMTLAVVKVDTPRRATITQTYLNEGEVITKGGTPIVIPSGLMVKEVAVKNGDMVAQGDLLLIYDVSSYQEKISALQLDLQSLQMQLANIKEGNTLTEDENKVKKERKEQDKDALEKNYEMQLEELGRQRQVARRALSKYNEVRREDFDGEEFSESEYQSLKSAYDALVYQYGELETKRENELQEWERSFNDIDTPKTGKDIELKQLEIQKTNLELNSLYKMVANKGAVYAETAGMVAGLQIEAGKMTPNDSVLTLSGQSDLEFVSIISKEQSKKLKVGDSAGITLYGEEKEYKDLKIASIQPMEDDVTKFKLTINVTGLEVAGNIGATAKVIKKSQMYDTCVPLSGLYSEGSQAYVLVLEEVNTALGTETSVRRVNVQVLEKNETFASISGALSTQDKVVTSSNKPLLEHSKVRLDGGA